MDLLFHRERVIWLTNWAAGTQLLLLLRLLMNIKFTFAGRSHRGPRFNIVYHLFWFRFDKLPISGFINVSHESMGSISWDLILFISLPWDFPSRAFVISKRTAITDFPALSADVTLSRGSFMHAAQILLENTILTSAAKLVVNEICRMLLINQAPYDSMEMR